MKEEITDTFALAEGGEHMKSVRTEWQVRCAFNSFCKKILKHGAINTYYKRRKQQSQETSFLTSHPKKKASFIQ